jgi:hypothetical protein
MISAHVEHGALLQDSQSNCLLGMYDERGRSAACRWDHRQRRKQLTFALHMGVMNRNAQKDARDIFLV